jgi:hypothetical protein
MQGGYEYNTEIEKSCLLLCAFWFRHKSISVVHYYCIISRSVLLITTASYLVQCCSLLLYHISFRLVSWQWMVSWIFLNSQSHNLKYSHLPSRRSPEACGFIPFVLADCSLFVLSLANKKHPNLTVYSAPLAPSLWLWYDMICLSTAVALPPGGSSTVHIYTQTTHRITQITTDQHR